MQIDINILAVLFAAFSVFILGAAWYSPMLFGNIWNQAEGLSENQGKKKHGAIVFILSFIFSFIAAALFAVFLGNRPSLTFAVVTGFEIGLGWVATSFGMNYLFANRHWKLLLIDSGYHIVQFTLYGLILGAWH